MNPEPMSSMERVLAALQHRRPDRIPLVLSLNLHGARELGIPLRQYFSRPEYAADAQIRMRRKYPHDAVLGFLYGAVDAEAWGGEVLFFDDGPPNAGEPVIRDPERITGLQSPAVRDSACLRKVLRLIEMLKARIGAEAPILSAVIAPFSLPIMQMGFDGYIEMLYGRPDLFRRLMALNEEFCVSWANAQLAAGATAIVYFDPFASPDMVPRTVYRETGLPIAKRCIGRIKGPVLYHLASARGLPILDDLAGTGAVCIGVSAREDLGVLKRRAAGRTAIAGNLNGVEMRRWTQAEAESAVKSALAAAGPGGGFLLTDNHGEIPWQVPWDVIAALSEAARRWGGADDG